MSPVGCRHPYQFEFELVLSSGTSSFSKIGDCALICFKAHTECALERYRFRPSCRAHDRRAARSEARRLTELGRLVPTEGEFGATFPMYSAASKKRKRQQEIEKILARPSSPASLLQGSRKPVRFPGRIDIAQADSRHEGAKARVGTDWIVI